MDLQRYTSVGFNAQVCKCEEECLANLTNDKSGCFPKVRKYCIFFWNRTMIHGTLYMYRFIFDNNSLESKWFICTSNIVDL